MGIDLVCEKWLTLPQNPSLIDIDNVISMTKSAKASSKKSSESAMSGAASATAAAGIVLKRTKSLDIYDSSSESESSPLPHVLQDKSSDNSYEMSTAFRGEVRKNMNVVTN